MKLVRLQAILLTLGIFLVSQEAAAHPGHGIGGFLHGFFHPLEGLDHLFAALAIGILGAKMGNRAIYALPATFVSALIVGGMLGFSQYSLPFQEAGIVLSLILLGGALFFRLRLPVAQVIPWIAAFGLFHGNAHGSEMAKDLSAIHYCLGFVFASTLLHGFGVGSVLLLKTLKKSSVESVSGFHP